MAQLFCFGLGYSAEHYVAEFGGRFASIGGTVRTPEKAERLAQSGFGGRPVARFVFTGRTGSDDVAAALADSAALLVSVQPDQHGDPTLRHFADAIAASPVACLVYLSTVGVYGDHQGGWVDETTAPSPVSARSRERLAAEEAWRALADRARKPLSILRLAGIYGPGQSALTNVAQGTAKRIVKPGQVFNRIHVADIARAIEGAIARRADGVFNISDDEPAPGQDVVSFAASLLKIEPPPQVAFKDAAKAMSPMALSFYGEVKRVRNDKMKRELGVTLRYPTYREGIRGLFEAGDHLGRSQTS